MQRRRLYIFVFVFVVVVSLYYIGIKPMFKEESQNFFYKDDFAGLNKEFWYAGSMQTNLDTSNQIDIKDGILHLEKNLNGEDIYLLSQPIHLGKKQVLSIKRNLRLDPAKSYFSAGLVVFQTNAKKLDINPAEKLPFGTSLFMLEYVKDPTGKSTRPGNNNIRVLPANWQETDTYSLINPIFDTWFKEEVIYDAYTGRIDYKIGDKTYTINGVPLERNNIRIWMHGYGLSAKQRTELDDITIRVYDLEDKDVGNESEQSQ